MNLYKQCDIKSFALTIVNVYFNHMLNGKSLFEEWPNLVSHSLACI